MGKKTILPLLRIVVGLLLYGKGNKNFLRTGGGGWPKSFRRIILY